MRRFTWHEMLKYWEVHDARYAKLDYGVDSDGLGNVCLAAAPLWLNRYYARFQKMTYQKLLAMLPRPLSNMCAVDVGCGAGRWCHLLNEQGINVVGIDLQRELIEINRSRYPDIKFICIPIQDYSTEEPFDLMSCVTVLQHIPLEEQDRAIEKFRELLRIDGYCIVLENIRDQGPHVFSRTIEGWRARFEKVGFSTVAMQRYDYSPFLRLLEFVRSGLQQIILMLRHRDEVELTPETLTAPLTHKDGLKYRMLEVRRDVQRLAMGLDSVVEHILVRSNIRLPTRHCGFLFKAI